jgi:anti-anti-sigma regulatory factor
MVDAVTSALGSPVLCLAPRGAIDLSTETRLLSQLEDRIRQGHRFTLLLDMSDVSYVRPAAMITVAAFMRAHRVAAKQCLTRSFIVATNQAISSLLSALFILHPPETEVVICSTIADAVAEAYPLVSPDPTRV